MILATLIVAVLLNVPSPNKMEIPRQRIIFDANWKFTRAPLHDVDLVSPKSDEVPVALKRSFDDSKWRTVCLPHDYVVEGSFDPGGDVSHGTLPKPVGYYRKTFVPPDSMRGKHVWMDFDGVYRNATFALNGKKLGVHPSGYIGARFDISTLLEYGVPNVIAVRVDPRENEGWWYEGGGIYRHVWLNAASPVHFQPDGTAIRCSPERGAAKIGIGGIVQNDSLAPVQAQIVTKIIDPRGAEVASASTTQAAPSQRETTFNLTVRTANPELWDLDTPRLYKAITSIKVNGKLEDIQTTSFGIRWTEWDKDRGFLLNGRPVKIKGTCNHQDFAGVGIAMPDRLQEWRIRKLKEMGSNAYRTSHNPPSPELLDACDRLGMLVLDENRHLGDTYLPKTPSGTRADDLSDLKDFVKRDRNHPSVIAWSLYNEEGLQGTDEGARIFQKMKAVVDGLDGTRPCTGANNYGYQEGVQLIADLYGYNYAIGEYDKGKSKFPTQKLFASETSSAVSTRGIYETDPLRGYVSAYDLNSPSWGATAEAAWRPVAERTWMAGAFVWTGFDYKGEPTPYGWPCINSHFGLIDIAGFPKDNFFYYKAWWKADPMVHLLPHWNWSDRLGQPVQVWVYSNAPRVELFLNGTSLGALAMPRLGHLEWKVAYAPGILEAKGYSSDGTIIASDRLETTGLPAALKLTSTNRTLAADGEDVSMVQVQVVDSKGRVVPTASNEVRFAVDGAGEIAGVGNGDPSDHDPDKADHRKAFNGTCMVLVRSTGRPGRIGLKVSSEGLKGASVQLQAIGGN
jgi:beta-galactosidase